MDSIFAWGQGERISDWLGKGLSTRTGLTSLNAEPRFNQAKTIPTTDYMQREELASTSQVKGSHEARSEETGSAILGVDHDDPPILIQIRLPCAVCTA
jgi:hypothetical protein